MDTTQPSNGGAAAVPFVKVLITQVVAYLLLIVVSLPSPAHDVHAAVNLTYTVVPVVVMMALFLWGSPLRDGVAGRVIAGIVGVGSLVCAAVQALHGMLFPVPAEGAEHAVVRVFSQETWAAGIVVLLIVLVLVSFARQMARENRVHLIRSLSHGVTGGVAMIAAPGWCFLPDFMKECGGATGLASTAVGVSCVVIVVLAVLLAGASYLWARDADPTPRVDHPYIGLGLMPVMLMGPVIAVASLIVSVL